MKSRKESVECVRTKQAVHKSKPSAMTGALF
jgi:hypothetical protein